MQRDKGAQAERAAAALLRLVYPDACRRASGEESQEAQGRDLKGTPGLCVQVKEMGAPSPLAALEEAIGAAAPGEWPIAMVRQSRRGASTPVRVVMRLSDALCLLEVRRRFDLAMPMRLAEIENDLRERLHDLANTDANMKARVE